ncbi:hypothetical protein PHYSODRAFT_489603 [Phytophthora sojae]|uniref:Uncharacterized protein n=1 Tax=Phytophthora sojae (strain P6497) TaxID=1094619 RepID=G4Z6B3_PHYSP|nr:hypothetical protein PHYSODRAFT_489603 [Phytophthora sojae]EGZ21728.1 hypothetical protein PHYSODRAFT_489603 [Phytophthora sojae]|eukprot:XP_009524445.1 hypothetical protein PHYSODRAFT_489603 [Phytophthora sojae]
MFDSKWEVRHGAVLSLRQILLSVQFTAAVEAARPTEDVSAQRSFVDKWLEECLIRCICVLALDQFVDYSADGSVSPVREVCAQVFGILLGSLSSEETLVGYLQVVRTLFSGSTWQACHGGLLGLKYLVRAHSNHAKVLVPRFYDDIVTAFSQSDSEEDVLVLAAEMFKDFAPYLDRVEDTGIKKAAQLLWGSLKLHEKAGLVSASIVEALSAWYNHAPVATVLQNDSEVSRSLWQNLSYTVPMLHHHSSSVRASSGICVAAIFSGEVSCFSSSSVDFARVFLPHLLLQLLLEKDESVQQSLLAAWKKVVSSLSEGEMLMSIIAEPLLRWTKLLWSTDDINYLNNMSSRVAFAEAIGFVLAHVPLSGACMTDLVKLFRDGMSSSSGARQCGILLALSKWSCFEKQLAQEKLDTQSQRVQHLLDSMGPTLSSFAGNQWITLHPDAVSDGRPVFYSEQLGSLKRVKQMEARIVEILSAVGISVQPAGRPDSASSADISRQIAEHVALFPYDQLQNRPKEYESAHFKRQDLFLVDELVQQSFSRFYHRIQGLGSSAFCELLPIPKKSGFLVKALMNSIKEEEEQVFRTISSQTIANFVVDQAHVQKKCVSKIISNLCNSAGALKTKVRVAGAEATLRQLCKRAGGSLFETCSALEDNISKAWNEPNADVLTIQRSMHLIVLMMSHVESGAMPTCLSWFDQLAQLIQRPYDNHRTRRIVAHAVATICKYAQGEHRESAMLVVYNSIFVAFTRTGSVDATEVLEGAVMVLDRIVHSLGSDLMPYVPSMVHYAMKTMSSQFKLVRTLAAGAFADLVPLIPLQMDLELHDSNKLLPDALRTIVSQNAVSRTFLESFTEGKAIQHVDVKSWLAPDISIRVYQQHGVDWLCFMANNNLHGILADDMGLGKTLQSLSAMAATLSMSSSILEEGRACLIVCPPIIVHHWIQEAKKYLPGFFESIIDYSLPASERKALNRKGGLPILDHGPTLIVTTYAILRTDIEFLSGIDYSFVVLDEAHLIRNPSTALFRAVLELRAVHRVALSGTPLQNNVTDLWALFEFLMPGYLGEFVDFRREFVLPITKSKERNATTKQKELAAIAIAQLHQKVLPFILRRTKDQVLEELPPKIISNVLLPLSSLQKRLYSLASSAETEATASSRSTNAKKPDTKPLTNVLTNLQLLRKICVHPALVADNAVTRGLNSKEMKALGDWKSSGKMTGLRDLLVECCDVAAWDQGSREGSGADADNLDETNLSPHRCLVFAHLQRTLDLTEQMLRDALPGVTYRRLDGQTPHAKRADIVQHFNADPSIDVLLLTTSVGGLGLTLTGADTVIFIEHSWNPFVDLQAMDRAHRIGQKRTVRVFRLIMEESLEEHILNLQEFKEQVAATVVRKSDAQTSMNTNTKGVLNLLQASSSAVAAKELRASVAAKKAGDSDDNIAAALPQGAQELLNQIGDLWDESQYDSLAFPESTNE